MKLGFPASLKVIGQSAVDWWDSWMDNVLVTVVWLVAQVTIIFGPPATFGYYYMAHNLVNGRSTGVRGLIEGARIYFKKAWLWGVVNLVVTFVTAFAAWFYINQTAVWALYAEILVLMVWYLWFCTQFYGLPYFMAAEHENLVIAFKNGLLTALAAPFFTFILMFLVLLVVAVSVGFVLPLILGLPGIIPILGYRAMYNRLEAFGLREREKTPKEIEVEQGARIYIPEFNRGDGTNVSIGDSAARRGSAAAGEDVADGEGQVEQKK